MALHRHRHHVGRVVILPLSISRRFFLCIPYGLTIIVVINIVVLTLDISSLRGTKLRCRHRDA